MEKIAFTEFHVNTGIVAEHAISYLKKGEKEIKDKTNKLLKLKEFDDVYRVNHTSQFIEAEKNKVIIRHKVDLFFNEDNKKKALQEIQKLGYKKIK